MRIVIAGGGLAAQRAAETLRRRGHDGPLTMVCAEPHLPYDRPPLSKELLAGDRTLADVTFRDEGWYVDHDVDLRQGVRAVGLEPGRLLTDAGALRHDRLLIATGARARKLPLLNGYRNVHVLRHAGHALALRAALRPGTRVVIIGAGFVGLEVASTAARLGAEVTVVDVAPSPLAAVLGPRLGEWIGGLHRQAGVDVVCGHGIARARGVDNVETLELDDGRRLVADIVLVAVGAGPDTSWLAATGLPCDGVPVGPGGNSALPRVFAAGDAARPVDPQTGTLGRQEHWEAAARGGARAALAILGLQARPEPPTGFWSDQHGVRIQLVGDPSGAGAPTVEGDLDGADFAAIWHRNGRPAAVLLAGRPHDLAAARRLIADPPPPERTAA